jgi:hypothetical protein
VDLAMVHHRDSLFVRESNVDIDQIRLGLVLVPRQFQMDALSAANGFEQFRSLLGCVFPFTKSMGLAFARFFQDDSDLAARGDELMFLVAWHKNKCDSFFPDIPISPNDSA